MVFKLFGCNIQGEIVLGKSANELILSFWTEGIQNIGLNLIIAHQTNFFKLSQIL